MKILILCLRRSGSTAFWKMFRQDRRIVCYDEPFNPMLKSLPKEFLKKTNTEIIKLYNEDRDTFERYFTNINSIDECKNNITERQIEYLHFLLNTNKNVVIDSTRLNFKSESLLKNLDKNVFVIHLYRTPIAFTTSHIIPNRPELKKNKRQYIKSKIRARINKWRFWTLKTNFNNWGYETIAKQLNIDTGQEAYKKLLAIWKISFDMIEKAGKKLGKNRFLSLSFEDFANDPYKILEKIYLQCDMEINKNLKTDMIKKPNLGFAPSHHNWKKYLKK